MAGSLTQKQQAAIAIIKPHELKTKFIFDKNKPDTTEPDTTECHMLAVECPEVDVRTIQMALVDLLPNMDDAKVQVTTIPPGLATRSPLWVAIIKYDVAPKNGTSSVKEVARLLADNGVNFPGSEKLRTKSIEP